MLSDALLLLRSLAGALWDILTGRSYRRYERSTLIRAPKDLVWKTASANKLRFEGPVPIEIDCAPDPDDPKLVTGAYIIGKQRLPVALREISERPGEAKIVQLLEEGCAPNVVFGKDHYVGFSVAEAPLGTLLNVTHELTHGRFAGRLLVPLGVAQNSRRLKQHCEKLAGIEPPARSGVQDAIMTGLITFASFLVLYGAESAALLILIILIHEAGHAVAMRIVGQPVQGIYFIPFFGGVAVAAAPHASEAERGFVALMGPGLSLISTALFFLLWQNTGNETLAQLALLSAIINGINLVPVLPLDGGHVTDALMSRWDAEFARGVSFVCLATGLAASIAMGWHIMTLFLALNVPVVMSGSGLRRSQGAIGRREQLLLAVGYLGALVFYAAITAQLLAGL